MSMSVIASSALAFAPTEPTSLSTHFIRRDPQSARASRFLEAALATTFRTGTAKVVAFAPLAPDRPSAWLDGPVRQNTKDKEPSL